jgi:type I restriction enzyme, S subunit
MMRTNEISGNSRSVILGDHIATQKGYAFKSEWYTSTGRQIVKVSNFTVDSIDVKEVVCIPEEIALEYLRYELKEGDVVIQTVGSWPNNPKSVVGKAIRIPYEVSGALLNQNAVKLTPDEEVDNSYLFHLLRSELFKSYIIGTAQGAANQASITLESIRSFSFYLPTLAVQRKIASILSAYDDLIENNTRRIKILEEMAQAIYREWFVEFCAPGVELRKATPEEQKLTGKDVFPKGWEIKTFGELVDVQKGKKPKITYLEPGNSNIPYLLLEGIEGGKYLYTDDPKVAIAVKEDVVMVMDGARSGLVFIGVGGAVGSTLATFRPKEKKIVSPYLLYQFLKDQFENIIKKNVGSAIPHASKDFILGMPFVTSTESINIDFHNILEPLHFMIQNLQTKNLNLRCTRDLLLPKLISGEVEVEAMEIVM